MQRPPFTHRAYRGPAFPTCGDGSPRAALAQAMRGNQAVLGPPDGPIAEARNQYHIHRCEFHGGRDYIRMDKGTMAGRRARI